MTAILLSLLGSGGSASPEVFVSGVSASGQVGFAGSQGSNTFSVAGVSANAQVGSVSAGLINNASVSLTGVQGASAVGSAQADGDAELPDGAILFFDRATTGIPIPNGFSLYTEYQGNSIVNFLIKGGSTNARTTGSPAPVSINSTNPVQSSTDGGHLGLLSPPSFVFTQRFPSPTGLSFVIDAANPAGAHSHSVTLTGSGSYPSAANFQGMQTPLIKSSGSKAQVPSGCIIFSGTSSGFTGCTRKSWSVEYGVYAASSSTNAARTLPTNISPSFGLSTAPAGTHSHATETNTTGGLNPIGPAVRTPGPALLAGFPNVGQHAHPGGTFGHVGAWKQFKHLLPFVANESTSVQSGMIVMYEGVSVPSGWKLCDGTNGTPDMIDKFIGYDNSLSTSDTLVGRDLIGSVGPSTTTPAPPPSAYGSTSIAVTINPILWTHSHSAAEQTQFQGQTFHHGNENFPHTHTIPNATVTMPNAYTPQHLTLIFIQKI
jgi:hypothetical protein